MSRRGGPRAREALDDHHENEEEFDEEQDVDMEDDGLSDEMEAGLFWSLTINPKSDSPQVIEQPSIPGFIVHITNACFGPTVNKGSRTCVVIQKSDDSDEQNEIPICILTEGNVENQSLDLIFNETASFELKGTKVSPVTLTGYIQPNIIRNQSVDAMDEDIDDEKDMNASIQKYLLQQQKVRKTNPNNNNIEEEENENDVDIDNDDQNNNNNNNNNINAEELKQESNDNTNQAPPAKKRKLEDNKTELIANGNNNNNANNDEKNENELPRKQAAKKKNKNKNKNNKNNNINNNSIESTNKDEQKENEKKVNEKEEETKKEKEETKEENKKNQNQNKENKKNKQLAFLKGGQGIKYRDMKVGNGNLVSNGQQISVFYVGQLASDNSVFDKCLHPQSPFTFKLGAGEVIKGWELGLKGMKVGGKRRLEIPAKHAYGDSGSLPKIPPKSTLIFTIELYDAK